MGNHRQKKKNTSHFYNRSANKWSNWTLDDICISNSKKKILKIVSETCCMDKKGNYKYIKRQESFQSHLLRLWLIKTTWNLPNFYAFLGKKYLKIYFMCFRDFSYVFGVPRDSIESNNFRFTNVWMFTGYWKHKIDILKGSIFELLTPPGPLCMPAIGWSFFAKSRPIDFVTVATRCTCLTNLSII